jgi:hypothetical protein
MEWYRVIKTIRGRRYYYWQKTQRIGGNVKTLNRYIGPVNAKPQTVLALAIKSKNFDELTQRFLDDYPTHREEAAEFQRGLNTAQRYYHLNIREVAWEKAREIHDDNPEIANPHRTSKTKIRELRGVLTNDEYSDENELSTFLERELGLKPAEAKWWASQRTWYHFHIVMNDGCIFDPKTNTVVDPRTGRVMPPPYGNPRTE